MLLTITTTHIPATDLGYLLHKHPARVQTFALSFGQAHIFYPQVGPECCTAALLLDVDPIKIVRNRRGPAGNAFALQQYVNDRPYVASSFLSVAIAGVFGSALNGKCKDHPHLVDLRMPLQAKVIALPCRGGEPILRRLFEPLGYSLSVKRYTLDEQFSEWGDSDYFTVELQGTQRLSDLLAHLYVLVPVLDDDKHYWVGDEEVAKLLHYGESWLAHHPECELITERYLKHQRHLVNSTLMQLAEEDDPDPEETAARRDEEEAVVEISVGLHRQRLEAVLSALSECGAARVLDLGCGEGKLLSLLLQDGHFTEIVGMDVSHQRLKNAAARLRLDELPDRQRRRITLIQGSLLYRDKRLAGYDAAALTEVIEHLEPSRLDVFERVLFEFAHPASVIVTTPNREYNAQWPGLAAGGFRHRDHRFEWTRAEFQAWAQHVADRYNYTVRFMPIGADVPGVGAPTQMGVFNESDHS